MKGFDYDIVDGPMWSGDVVSAMDVFFSRGDEKDILEINLGAEEREFRQEKSIGQDELVYTLTPQSYRARGRETYQVPEDIATDEERLVENLLSKYTGPGDDWGVEELE